MKIVFKKEYYLYILSGFIGLSILFILSIIFYNKLFGKGGITTDEYKENIKIIEQIEIEKEQLINSGYIDENYLINSFTGLIDTELFSGINSNVSLEELKTDYTNAFIKGDNNSQILLLEQIYHISKDDKYLYPIITKAKETYNFNKAFVYVQMLYNKNNSLGELNVDDFMNIMLNHLDIDTENLKKIEGILSEFKKEKIISTTKYNYYNSILALVTNNKEKFYSHFSGISEGNYNDYKNSINQAIQTYESYRDAPEYYLTSLISLVLFQEGLLKPAEKMSLDVLKQNSKYILPNQILAYSNFLKGDYDNAKKYFSFLIEEDGENANTYQFFLGITHYWGGKYEDAIIFFSQVKDGIYLIDAARYMILSYSQIGDTKNIINLFKILSNSNHLTEYDYYTFFDMVFFKPYEQDTGFQLLKENSKLTMSYLSSCQKTLGKSNNYICIYGKGGYLLASGNPEKGLKYLLYLVKYYPRNYVFKAIGDIYAKKGDVDKAKKYYINGVLSSQEGEEKAKFKKELIKYIMKTKN